MPTYRGRKYPEWLVRIGIRVDEWVTDPKIRRRFQEQLSLWCNEQTRRDKTSGVAECPFGDRPGVQLPFRSMPLPEKYAVLHAIHGVVCKDAKKPLQPWREKNLKGRAFNVGFVYARLKNGVCGLTDDQEAGVLDVVRDVARDLGKPNPFRRKAGQTTLVVNVLNQRTAVPVGPQRAPENGGKTAAEASRELPWNTGDPRFVTATEAVDLSKGAIALYAISKLCKPTGPFRYMRKPGAGCRVHTSDFRKYIKARPRDPDNDLAREAVRGIEDRKEEAHRSKLLRQ